VSLNGDKPAGDEACMAFLTGFVFGVLAIGFLGGAVLIVDGIRRLTVRPTQSERPAVKSVKSSIWQGATRFHERPPTL
jgi:hypothetical protein